MAARRKPGTQRAGGSSPARVRRNLPSQEDVRDELVASGLDPTGSLAFARYALRLAKSWKPSGQTDAQRRKTFLETANALDKAAAVLHEARDHSVIWDALHELSIYGRRTPVDNAGGQGVQLPTIDKLEAFMREYSRIAHERADRIGPISRGKKANEERYRPLLFIQHGFWQHFKKKPTYSPSSEFIRAAAVVVPLFLQGSEFGCPARDSVYEWVRAAQDAFEGGMTFEEDIPKS